jgi:hypothetical protein
LAFQRRSHFRPGSALWWFQVSARIFGATNPDLSRYGVDLDQPLWRYLDVGKFLHIVTTGSIWFTRALEFAKSDPYEGALTPWDLKLCSQVLGCDNKEQLSQLMRLNNWGSISDFIESEPIYSLEYFKVIFLSTATKLPMWKYTYAVSCWHMNSVESDAMWQLYAIRQAGIALKSSPRRMIDAFAKHSDHIDIAKVQYDDNGIESALTSVIYAPILIKRPSFSHEKEVRLITSCLTGFEKTTTPEGHISHFVDYNKKGLPLGQNIPCNLESLIEEIVISPQMAPHYETSIRVLLQALALRIPIRKSDLDTYLEVPLNFDPKLHRIWTRYQQTGLILDESGDGLPESGP